MELYQLRYALAVGENQSFTRAARTIPVSVASVSAAIRDLELELGVVLFERTTRRVRPTPAGALFLERAARVLADLAATQVELDPYRGTHAGSVTLGSPPTIVARNLPTVLAAFLTSYPVVDLRLIEARGTQLLDSLKSREVDLTLHTSYPGCLPDDVDFYELDRMETGVALAPGHPLASEESIALASLADLPMIVYSPGFAMRDIAFEVCQRAGIRPRVALETAVSHMLCGLVRAGLGFTIVSRTRALNMGLAFVRCIPSPMDRVLTLAWLRNRPLSPTAVLLREEIFRARDWLVL